MTHEPKFVVAEEMPTEILFTMFLDVLMTMNDQKKLPELVDFLQKTGCKHCQSDAVSSLLNIFDALIDKKLVAVQATHQGYPEDAVERSRVICGMGDYLFFNWKGANFNLYNVPQVTKDKTHAH